MNEDTKNTQACAETTAGCRCKNGVCVNTHFTLAIVAVCISCFTGFFSIPLSIAALIFSLRAQDQVAQAQLEDARRTAFWAGLFGWITVAFALIPLILILLFGGFLLTLLTAGMAAA